MDNKIFRNGSWDIWVSEDGLVIMCNFTVNGLVFSCVEKILGVESKEIFYSWTCSLKPSITTLSRGYM